MKLIKTDPKRCLNCCVEFVRGRLQSGRIEAIENFRGRKFCSKECYAQFNCGRNNPGFSPHGRPRKDGYVRTFRNGRRVYMHRMLMEVMEGRALLTTEHVHHKDHDPLNNDPSNLEIQNSSDHSKFHSSKIPRDQCGRFTCER